MLFLAVYTPLAVLIVALGVLADRYGQGRRVVGRRRRGRHVAGRAQKPT